MGGILVTPVAPFMPTSASVTYATWNPADKGSNIVLSGGNLKVAVSTNGWNSVRATISKSTGKWYWETQFNAAGASGNCMIGIANGAFGVNSYLGSSAQSGGADPGQLFGSFLNGITCDSNTNFSISANQWTGIAFDAGAGKIWFNVNGTWVQHDPTGTDMWSGITGSGPYYPAATCFDSTVILTTNFGASAFQFTVPSGFNAGVY